MTREVFAAGPAQQSGGYAYGVFLYHPWAEPGNGYYFSAFDQCVGEVQCTALAANPTVTWTATQPTGALQVRIVCDQPAGQVCPATPDSLAGSFTVTRADVTLDDPSPPVLTGVNGPLLAADRSMTGPQQFTVSAADAGSGVARVVVVVDGLPVQSFPVSDPAGTCAQPYAVPVPCPLSVSQTFTFDTSSLADGPHTLQIAVQDATLSPSNQAISPAVTISINRRGAFNGSPVTSTAMLTAAFSRLHGKTRAGKTKLTVPFGSRPSVYGKLETATGQPIVGARLLVWRRSLTTGGWYRVGAAVTSARGTYGFRMRPGPSRTVEVAFLGASLDTVPLAVATVTLDVRAGVRAVFPRVMWRGHRYAFTGRVLGGRISAGKLVEIQALQRSSWVTFATAQTNARGEFVRRYRFAAGPAAQHLLRAVVPAQSDFPFAQGASTPMTSRVL